jgi:subtilisin family serine protease
MLDLLAPGAMITASGLGGGLSTYVGTSQAAPTAAGVAALMLEANDSLTPAQIEAVLRDSGPPLPDLRNGLSIPSVNARVAVSAVAPSEPLVVQLDAPSIALPDVAYQLTTHVSPVTTTLPLTYTWQATGQAQVVHTTNSISDSMVYSWPAPGPQVVTVTVRNELGMLSTTATVDVVEGVTLNLPRVERE